MTKTKTTLDGGRTVTPVSEQIIPVRIAFNPLAVEQAKTEAIAQLNDLQGATIDNDDELQVFSALLVDTVRERKLIETMRDEVLSPIKAALKAATATIDALFKPTLSAKEASELKLRELVGGYQQLKAAEQRRLMSEAAAAAQARKPAELTTALIAAGEAAPKKIASVGVKETWVARIKSPDLVPYEWCTPDEKRIQAHAKATPIDRDPTPIGGVLYERVASTTVRS